MKKVLIIDAGGQGSALTKAIVNRLGGIQFSKSIDPVELGQPGFEVRFPDADISIEDDEINRSCHFDEERKISTPEQEKRKSEILTDLYLTGRLKGLYFGVSSRCKKNPIKHYIKSCLYKNRIEIECGIIEDCYNQMFEHLCLKPAHKICELYDTSPKKLMATALKIIALKCFAKDPRYNNPNHSLVQKMIHNSARHENAIQETDEKERSIIENIKDPSHEESDFFKLYGFEVEDLIERLNPQQRADFYECIGKQRRGKVSAPLQAKRDELFEVIKQIKNQLKN